MNIHLVSFLIDTGATRSTVYAVDVPNLLLFKKEIQVVGVSNNQINNQVSTNVPVKIRTLDNDHEFIICEQSPVNLLGRGLLCEMHCVIYCTPDVMAIQMQYESSEFKIKSQESKVHLFPALTKEDLPPGLRHAVEEEIWDFAGSKIGLI